ncbi:MAG: efflux RND transporter periplasmic adaptor subunit [Ignavibacteriae bacterium]|nr:efflux RND transporter periplasmic adaptor subunit [Ignavibacteriota bacterium]
MKKILLYIIVVILIVGTGGYFYFRDGSNGETKYRTEKIGRGDVIVQVRATGTINPVQTVQVGSQVSGILSKIYVDFNDVVHAGQIVAQIDSTFLNASVKEAEANVERNQAQVNEAKRTVKRTNELFEKNLVSQSELDAVQTTYESALAQMKQAQAALDRARVNLRYSTIISPIDGVVISRDVDVGQTVAASLQAPKLFSIANDLTHMQVEASVDEADIGQIKEGQSVMFTVDSYPEETFEGTVKQVRLAPVLTQNVVTYTVIIEVPNPDLKLRPGMTATVSVLIEKKEHVVRVPTLALRFQPPAEVLEKFDGEKPNGTTGMSNGNQSGERMNMGGGSQGRGMMKGGMGGGKMKSTRVWVTTMSGELKPVKIKLGLNDNRFAEVLEGELKEGDEIVLGLSMPEMAAGGSQQSNPFAPRMPGGGGRGMR